MQVRKEIIFLFLLNIKQTFVIIVTYMENWSTRIDKYLLADDLDVLKDAGKISHEIACDKALTEFEKYRVIQDKLYKSDFDLLLEESSK